MEMHGVQRADGSLIAALRAMSAHRSERNALGLLQTYRNDEEGAARFFYD